MSNANRIVTAAMLTICGIFLLSGCGNGSGQNPLPDTPPPYESPESAPDRQNPAQDLHLPGDSGETAPDRHDPSPNLDPPDDPPEQHPEDSGEWKVSYLDIINEVGVSYMSWADIVEGGVTSVSFSDLTNDGTPELVFTEIDGDVVSFSVYSFVNGRSEKLVFIDRLVRVANAEYYEAYSTHDGSLIVYGSSSDLRNTSSHYYIFDDVTQPPREVVLSIKWKYGHDGVTEPEFFIDESYATEEEYGEYLGQIYEGAANRLASDGFAPLRASTADVSMSFREAEDFLKK